MECIKNRLINTVRATTVGILSFAGTFTINPPEVKIEVLTNLTAKVLDYIPTYSLDPYTQCGGEGYLDNEIVLITPQEDETTLVESLGIIPGECGNPLPQEDVLPTPTPKPEPQPTPTTIIFPRYPQIPLPDYPPTSNRPEVRGSQECIDKSNAALDFSKEKANLEYRFVVNTAEIIACVNRENASTSNNPPGIEIGYIFLRMSREDLSSVFVHESCHLWQRGRFRQMYPKISTLPGGISSGKEAEAECYTVEYYYLKKVGASQETLNTFADLVNKTIGIKIPLQ